MFNWLIKLWTSSFIKEIKLGQYKVLVNIDFGGYMFVFTLVVAGLGILAGVGICLTVMKFLNK